MEKTHHREYTPPAPTPEQEQKQIWLYMAQVAMRAHTHDNPKLITMPPYKERTEPLVLRLSYQKREVHIKKDAGDGMYRIDENGQCILVLNGEHHGVNLPESWRSRILSALFDAAKNNLRQGTRAALQTIRKTKQI